MVKANRNDTFAIILYAGLLFLRFPFIILLSFHVLPISGLLGIRIFLDGTYIFTSLLIWWKRELLALFNITRDALIIFIIIPIINAVSCFIYYLFTRQTFYFSWVQLIIAIIVGILIYPSFKTLPKLRLKQYLTSLILAFICGAVLGIISAYFMGFEETGSLGEISIWSFFDEFITQTSIAAIPEEVLFRGFTWGFLRRIKVKEYWILIIQLFMFIIGHVYFLETNPYVFWIVIPTGGFLMGIVVWKTRSIGHSMITHSLGNAFGNFINQLR